MKKLDISTKTHPNTFAIVDDEDFEWASQWKWFAHRNKDHFYAARSIPAPNNERRELLLHRELMKAPIGLMVDHKNRNGLDNRKENLRICTNQQNQWNRKKARNGKTSRFIGVRWHKGDRKFYAEIQVDGRRKHLGGFASEEDAAIARDKAVIKYHGPYANLNNVGASPEGTNPSS
jgi:hypothetical protein